MPQRHYELAACGLLTTDADGRILAVNQTLLTWMGHERNDLVGRLTFSDLLTGGGRIYHETHYAPMLAMQGFARELAFDLVCADESRLPVLVNARTDVHDDQRVVHMAIFDATERRMYERELLAAKEDAERSEARARLLARTLQQSLLPNELPTVPGLEIAGRYLPAGTGDEIGGDFYDVFQIGAGDWAIALGDVQGKGVDAAVVTTLVRHSIRAASVEHEPAGALRIVNEVLLKADVKRFCTVVLFRCRVTAGSWRVTFCCAGHPLPILGAADGAGDVGRPGTLLGLLPEVTLHDVDIPLDDSSVLVAYTDGVSEARRGGEMFGPERIAEVVGRAGGESAEAVLDRLVAASTEFGGIPNQDDIAAIAVRPAGSNTAP